MIKSLAESVKEIMHTDVVTTKGETKMIDIAKLLMDKGIGCIIITENSAVKGLITERDIVKTVSEGTIDEPASLMMTTTIKTVAPDDSILKASNIMKELRVKRIPVTEDGKLVGIVTQTDINHVVNEMVKEFNYLLAKNNIQI